MRLHASVLLGIHVDMSDKWQVMFVTLASWVECGAGANGVEYTLGTLNVMEC